MKFALLDGARSEPQHGLRGCCPACGEPVIAKCGDQRSWHWAHARRKHCDPWWEPETEWHRRWKNLFPEPWQENPLRSETTGELHIADIRTPSGLVLEFQRSAISPAERLSREQFYQNMLWIVDGTRLKSDRARIDKRLPDWRLWPEYHYRVQYVIDNFLPRSWVSCGVPVLFDFAGLSADAPSAREHLICLLPDLNRDYRRVFFPMSRATLVGIAKSESNAPGHQRIFGELGHRR